MTKPSTRRALLGRLAGAAALAALPSSLPLPAAAVPIASPTPAAVPPAARALRAFVDALWVRVERVDELNAQALVLWNGIGEAERAYWVKAGIKPEYFERGHHIVLPAQRERFGIAPLDREHRAVVDEYWAEVERVRAGLKEAEAELNRLAELHPEWAWEA